MRLGLVARADNSGLGMQTWEFYRHMKPQKVMVVDISHLNGNKVYPERFNSVDNWCSVVHGIPSTAHIDAFLTDLDVIFVAEAPYNYYLYSRARELGVKVAVQYNYEFFDWFMRPDLPLPDMLIAPSLWHYSRVDLFCNANSIRHMYLHCPVNREVLPPLENRQARTFLHTAGRSAAHDRNGTKTVIEASKYLKTPAHILIHFQGEQGLAHQATMTTKDYEAYLLEQGNPERVKIMTTEFSDYTHVYSMGDVLVLPRRYGGNCLPLNEALSTGMPAIMTEISPNNKFLPPEWLIPAEKVSEFSPRTTIDIYGGDPKALAATIDKFYNMSEEQMYSQSLIASSLADLISWETMQPQYQRALEELCTR